MRTKMLLMSWVILLTCFPSSAATRIQEETDEAAKRSEADSEEDSGAVLDEILVTAQKVEQNQRDVPISLTTLDTEQIEIFTTAGVDIRFLSGRVPSLTIESSFGRAFPRFYMRGLGNTDFDLNASQPVSMLYDEVVLENPILKGMPIWDLDRTEVLRGPQGTLFGRNTPAGVVKFESKKPSQEKDSFARLSWGTYNTVDFRGALGGPLSDTFSARLSVLYQSRSDWVDNGFTQQNNALGGYATGALRVQFLWQPTERFSGLLNLHGWDVDGTARIFRANVIEPGTNDLVSGFRQDQVFHDGLNQQDIESKGGVLKFTYDFNSLAFTSVTGYETVEMFSRGDIDGGFGAVFFPPFGPGFIPFPSETADGIPDLNQFTQEFRLTSDYEGPLNWLAGFFYFDEDFRAETYSFDSFSPGNPQDGFAFQEQQAEAWGVFGSLIYQATERLNLRAGLRYSADKKDFLAERPDPTFNTPTLRPLTVDTDDDFTSWDLTAMYQINSDVNVYGRLATGFRAPSIQGRILFAPDFDFGQNPETNGLSVGESEDIFSAEVGLKSELLNRKLRFNFTPYWYEVNNQQITVVGGQFNVNRIVNSDKTEGYGFECDLQLAPRAEWLLTFGLSNNNTEIQDDALTIAPCAACTITDPIAPNGEVILDGNSLPHAPEWIFNGIIDYRGAIGNGLLIGTLDWAWHDDKRFFLYESKEFFSKGFELGLRLGYTFKEARYEFALYGRNITDQELLRGGIDFNNLTGFSNDPSIWGLEFVARF